MERYRPWPVPATVPLGYLGIGAMTLGLVGMLVGAYATFGLGIDPYGGILFVLSFIALVMASLYAMVWQWDHIPVPEQSSTTPTEPAEEVLEPASRR